MSLIALVPSVVATFVSPVKHCCVSPKAKHMVCVIARASSTLSPLLIASCICCACPTIPNP